MNDATDKIAREYSHEGFPPLEELIAAQALTFPRDPRDLLGNFWPEDESVDEFLASMRDWRGHAITDPAA